MIGEIESRLAAKLQPSAAPAEAAGEAVTGRLAEIERRMGEIAGQLSAPRPLGRRGKPLASEMRDAVAEVRRRQRELEEGGENRPAALPEAPRAAEPAGLPSPAIVELQQETTRLRDSLGGLATGRDVGALEQAMRALVTDMQRAREPGDFAAIAAPIELMRVQVERLAEDVADNVHARVAGEVERLAGKVDGAISGAAPSFADQNALDTVFQELDEIRRLIGALAGPERIQSLAQGVQAISAQIAQLQRGSDAEVAALKPLLEEIRSELKGPEESRALLGRFEALADRMDRAAENPAANPVGELIGRLETLGESLRQQPAAPKDFSSIQGMLETLAEKVDRVNTDGRGLDALEQHVVALAHRLDAPKTADPALGRLERTMGDLVAQVSALKAEAPAKAGPDLEAALERATRAAVKDALAGSPPDEMQNATLGLLRADLAEMRAQQSASDQRLHATLEGVQALLSRLSEQLDRAPAATMTSASAMAAAAPARAGHAASVAAMELPLAETVADKAPRERSAQERPAAPKAPARPRPAARIEDALDEVILGADELLEPGAGRPSPGARPRRTRPLRRAPTSRRASSPPPAAPPRPRRRRPRASRRSRPVCASGWAGAPALPRPSGKPTRPRKGPRHGRGAPWRSAAARCCSASPPWFWRSAPIRRSRPTAAARRPRTRPPANATPSLRHRRPPRLPRPRLPRRRLSRMGTARLRKGALRRPSFRRRAPRPPIRRRRNPWPSPPRTPSLRPGRSARPRSPPWPGSPRTSRACRPRSPR